MVAKTYLQLDLTWVPAGPLHVGTGESGPGLVDRGVVRFADGKPYVPGSSLKGRVRHYAAALYRARRSDTCPWQRPPNRWPGNTVPGPRGCGCPLCLLFGAPGFAPGALVFSDLLPVDEGVVVVRSSTAVDRRRRTVLAQRLFSVEAVYPPELTGSVYGWLPADAVSEAAGLLYAALRLVPHLGGSRSRGLGWGRLEVKVRAPQLAAGTLEEWVRQWI